MAKNPTIREIAAANLIALMSNDETANTLDKLAAKSGVGRGTIDRMKKSTVAVTLDTLESIAKTFKLLPWQLIHPKMQVDPMQEELLTIFSELDARGRDFLLQSARRELLLTQTTASRGAAGR